MADPVKPPPTPKQKFASLVFAVAEKELVNLFGSEQGRAAAARVAAAFRTAAATAKDPDAFWACTPESVASCMVTSAFTGIMPGGPFPGCWLIPKRRNIAPKGERAEYVWELHWWINHRGIKTLARRAGQSVEAIPYFDGDEVVIERGRNWRVEVVEGDNADRNNIEALAGVVYYVSDIETGALLAARKMTRSQIGVRRAKSDTVNKDTGDAFGPWRDWPIEMAEKTAIKFAAGRGDVFFDDVGNMALSREAETQVIDTTGTTMGTERAPATNGRAALGLTPKEAPALPDHGEQRAPNYAAEGERLNSRERVAREDDRAANEDAARRDAAEQDDGAPV
jgi:recombinational DNA repair protein RecT